jgi:HD-GYP domain-containing protein (c-di-GMP phosphodiesterase class II)
MRARRPYRAALSETAAVDELRRLAGHQFDPRVVEAFLAVLDGDESLTSEPVAAVPVADHRE